MFPHIKAEQRRAALGERAVLIRRLLDAQFLAVGCEPRPAAAELRRRGFGDLRHGGLSRTAARLGAIAGVRRQGRTWRRLSRGAGAP